MNPLSSKQPMPLFIDEGEHMSRETTPPRLFPILGLLLMTILIGCEAKKPGVPFEIIDSGVVANSAGGGHVVWLDNETIVFTRRLPPGYPPPHNKYKINFSLWTWNYKTNEFHMLSDDSSDRYCREDGTLYYWHRGQQFSATPVKQGGRYMLEDETPLPDNHHLKTFGDAHCSVIDNANPPPSEIFEDLRAFNARVIKRWHADAPEDKRYTNKYDTVMVSDQFPQGKLIPELKGGDVLRYFEHSHQYLIRRISPHSPKGVTRNEAIFEYRLLSKDGSVDLIPLPDEWPRAIEAYVTRAGLVIASDNLARDPRLSKQGIWLFTEDGRRISEVVAGYSNMEALSPNGCRLALSHKPKIVPFGKSLSSLKVIDFC